MNLNLIRKLSETYEGGLRKLASDIGMSEANMHRCINNNKMQASDLEKVAQRLAVNIGVFFDDNVFSGWVKKQTTATCENEWERRTQLLHQNNVTQIIALCHKLVDNYQQQNNTIAQLANLLEQLDNNTRQHEPLRETTPQTNNTPEM